MTHAIFFGITAKLFAAFLVTNIVTAVVVGWGVRAAFDTGFGLRERSAKRRLARLAACFRRPTGRELGVPARQRIGVARPESRCGDPQARPGTAGRHPANSGGPAPGHPARVRRGRARHGPPGMPPAVVIDEGARWLPGTQSRRRAVRHPIVGPARGLGRTPCAKPPSLRGPPLPRPTVEGRLDHGAGRRGALRDRRCRLRVVALPGEALPQPRGNRAAFPPRASGHRATSSGAWSRISPRQRSRARGGAAQLHSRRAQAAAVAVLRGELERSGRRAPARPGMASLKPRSRAARLVDDIHDLSLPTWGLTYRFEAWTWAVVATGSKRRVAHPGARLDVRSKCARRRTSPCAATRSVSISSRTCSRTAALHRQGGRLASPSHRRRGVWRSDSGQRSTGSASAPLRAALSRRASRNRTRRLGPRLAS